MAQVTVKVHYWGFIFEHAYLLAVDILNLIRRGIAGSQRS